VPCKSTPGMQPNLAQMLSVGAKEYFAAAHLVHDSQKSRSKKAQQ